MYKTLHRLGRHPAVLRKTNSSKLTQRLQIHRILPESSATIGYWYDSCDQYRQYINEIKAMHDKYHAMPAAQINEYVKALPNA